MSECGKVNDIGLPKMAFGLLLFELSFAALFFCVMATKGGGLSAGLGVAVLFAFVSGSDIAMRDSLKTGLLVGSLELVAGCLGVYLSHFLPSF